MPECWGQFGGRVCHGARNERAVGFFDGVKEFPCRAGLVGWAGGVGVVDVVVEDCESHGVDAVDAESGGFRTMRLVSFGELELLCTYS